MNRCVLPLCVAVAIAIAIAPGAEGRNVVASLDASTLPINPGNGFSGFSFGDFPPPGLISQPPSLIFDITDIDFVNGVFGGIGVDFVLTPEENGVENQRTRNFGIGSAQWEVRLKKLPGNEATTLRTTMIDIDGPEQDSGGGEGGLLFASGDEHVYEFDLSLVPDDGQFHTLTKPVGAPLFTQGAFGLAAGNGVVDPGLRQIQIQSLFGSTERLHIEVAFARVTIPEPASALLFACGSVALATRRQRRA